MHSKMVVAKRDPAFLSSEPEDLPALVDPESSDTSRDNSEDECVPDLVDLESPEDSDDSDNDDDNIEVNILFIYFELFVYLLLPQSVVQFIFFVK